MRTHRILASLFLIMVLSPLAASDDTPYRLFPSLYRREAIHRLPQTVDRGRGKTAADELSARIPLLANNTIVAYYGHPSSTRMGILGWYPKEEVARRVKDVAAQYDAVNGSDGVVSAFYIIYGTCWPGGEIGYLSDEVLKSYIEYALAHDMLVFVDHQIGKYSVAQAMEKILPFLSYPNVHLAIDPEWRTLTPMKEIGSITAGELNQAQDIMQKYIVRNGVQGIRMLVVHQFADRMIRDRQTVRADFDQVLLVHTADGFGSPSLKRKTYALNAQATNMPVKGFKLFYKSEFPLAGWDNPLLTPAEVMALDPRPGLIMYQ